MDVIVLIALVWLFLLVLAVAILRTAGLAERATERRLRELQTRRVSAEQRQRARTAALIVAAMSPAGAGAPAPGRPSRAARTLAPLPRRPVRT